MMRPITQRLAQLATAGAVVAFALSLARHHPDASTAAESGFLALVLGFSLSALALSRTTAPAVVPGGALIALALCLPAAEGTRGALVMALLVATVGFASWRVFTGEGRIAFLDIAALTIAWQCVLRSERFLDWHASPRSAVWLVALPLAAAAAAWWHSRRHGGADTFVLLAAICVLAPGLGVVPVAVLICAAALTGDHGRSWQAATVAAGACVVAIWWLPAVAPALLVLVAALALGQLRLYAWLPLAGALAWAVITILSTGGSVGALGWLLLAVPLTVLAPAPARPLALAALALALTHRPEATPALLAPAMALAALALPAERRSRRLQANWSLALLALVAVSAAYPWLRHPLTEPIPGLGLPVQMLGVLVVSLGCLFVLAATKWPETLRWRVSLTLLGLLLLAWAARQPRRLIGDPILLTSQHGTWKATPAAGTVRTLTVDSFLNRAETLGPDQPVAYLLLTSRDGGRQRFALRNGRQTADWAARRLGLDDAPSSWLSWHAGDGTLARRYRATWRLSTPQALERIELVRADGLAPQVEVAILSVALR